MRYTCTCQGGGFHVDTVGLWSRFSGVVKSLFGYGYKLFTFTFTLLARTTERLCSISVTSLCS